jgi:hypothetical protein
MTASHVQADPRTKLSVRKPHGVLLRRLPSELTAAAHEHVSQVVGDGVLADEQPLADLCARQRWRRGCKHQMPMFGDSGTELRDLATFAPAQ